MSRRFGALVFLVLSAGCRPPLQPVFVDLDAILVPAKSAVKRTEIRSGEHVELPGSKRSLQALQGAQLALSDSVSRVREARKLLAENRETALKDLTQALYRSYSRKALAERHLQERDLEKMKDRLWDEALKQLHGRLQVHAKDRIPLQNKLALLVGFPSLDPSLRPKPENPQDAKAYGQAVAAWKELLETDRQFAKEAQSIFEAVEAELNRQRAEIQVAYAKSLGEAAEKSQSEANAAVQTGEPEFAGVLAQSGDLVLRALSGKPLEWKAVPPPKSQEIALPEAASLRREFLAQELEIWMAQNGYRRAESPREGKDRTKEFAAWIRARRAGL